MIGEEVPLSDVCVILNGLHSKAKIIEKKALGL